MEKLNENEYSFLWCAHTDLSSVQRKTLKMTLDFLLLVLTLLNQPFNTRYIMSVSLLYACVTEVREEIEVLNAASAICVLARLHNSYNRVPWDLMERWERKQRKNTSTCFSILELLLNRVSSCWRGDVKDNWDSFMDMKSFDIFYLSLFDIYLFFWIMLHCQAIVSISYSLLSLL